MNCIFICVFNQEQYVEMFLYLLESLRIYGNLGDNLGDNTQILVYTSSAFRSLIQQQQKHTDQICFEINDSYNTVAAACEARLDLFNLSSSANYEKILYLDTDIIVKSSLNPLWAACSEDILYVLEEGFLSDKRDFYGASLFGTEIQNYKDKTAFTSGILLFKNCEKIRALFQHIRADIIKRPHTFECFDQPYIVYNAFKYNLYNNQILKAFAVNNDHDAIHSQKIIHHFPGCHGVYKTKLVVMKRFLNKLYKNGLDLYDIYYPPLKNTAFSLIGICVSYNYFDTLQFMLPVNYLHFEKIYLITQRDDLETIEFCKQFANVQVLFYNFKNNGKKFDKFGALNMAQQIAYTAYPDSWYLLIDSDVLLPNNFIDILCSENLQAECIYGSIRNNVFKSSELLNKFALNNWKNNPPSILGCFQLYKKTNIYHRDCADAGYGDYYFGHDNFNMFCNLDNLMCFHLGQSGVNWRGKTVSFIDDVKIALRDIYFICQKKANNVYYNKACQMIKYGNSENIDHDIWTCSDQMRYDIDVFFKDKKHFKIAEIGAHKGYTTKILANIFETVYAVDNSVEWTALNQELNKAAGNIEYVMLDIYKNSWDILPDDIEVSFIDAVHSYEGCKSDIVNSLKRFKNLQFIVFDDYGVWPGVKQIVDELLENKTFVFERFIGITNVPGPNGLVKNVHEGIICRINKNAINTNASFKPMLRTYNNGFQYPQKPVNKTNIFLGGKPTRNLAVPKMVIYRRFSSIYT